MQGIWVPLLLAGAVSGAVAVGLVVVGWLVGPARTGRVKEMPYESGMDPVHDARRRFDVRFHLVAIVFLVFDVELLFLYPWAVASRQAEGLAAAVSAGEVASSRLVFGEVMVFLALLAAGLVYAWRKGVFQWR